MGCNLVVTIAKNSWVTGYKGIVHPLMKQSTSPGPERRGHASVSVFGDDLADDVFHDKSRPEVPNQT